MEERGHGAIKNTLENAAKCSELFQKVAELTSEAATQETRAARAIEDLMKAEAYHLELFDKISEEEMQVTKANHRCRSSTVRVREDAGVRCARLAMWERKI